MVSKTQKAANLQSFHLEIAKLEQLGCDVSIVSQDSYHYRVDGPLGRRADLYATTRYWVALKEAGKKGPPAAGNSMKKLLSYIAGPAEPNGFPSASTGPAIKPDVVIFSDASFCPSTGAAGWGAWMIREDMNSETFGGALAQAKTPFDAEMQAIANSMVVAKLKGFMRQGNAVMIQSDCINALSSIRATTGARCQAAKDGLEVCVARRPAMSRALARIIDLAKGMQLDLIVRHVKGHQSGDGRNWVNRKVDEIARFHMIEKRKGSADAA